MIFLMFNFTWLSKSISQIVAEWNIATRYHKMRHYKTQTLDRAPQSKCSETNFTPIITLHSRPRIFSVLSNTLSSLRYCFHTLQSFGFHPIPPQSSVPGKVSQDDVRLDPVLPVRPASCCFGSCKLK